MNKNKKRFVKHSVRVILIFAIIYLSYLIVTYNYPNKVDSKISGILIDYKSYSRGTSIDKCHLDSIDEFNPASKSTYWFGCKLNNYSNPVFIEVYFPFDIEIISYGSCSRPIQISPEISPERVASFGEEKCYSFDARVIDGHRLQLIYNDSEVPYEQLKISANIFSIETPDRYVFKSFQIKENPLPFLKSGKLVFQNNNIDYSIKIKRDKFQILSSDSNFAPNIQNEITGDFKYQRIFWDSGKMPGEGILYISDVEQARFKTLINLFGTLFLGIFLGILIEKIIK